MQNNRQVDSATQLSSRQRKRKQRLEIKNDDYVVVPFNETQINEDFQAQSQSSYHKKRKQQFVIRTDIPTCFLADKIKSDIAEVPDPIQNPRLHEIVNKNMIHGPCGDWYLDETGSCSKHYPKAFNNLTTLDEDGYPLCKRRNNETYSRQDESDANGNQIRNEIHHDEIRNYIETRYVSPPEACARILNYSLHGRSHAVLRLAVHLPNQQSVMIEDIDNNDAIQTALNRESMLLAYFALNRHDPQARYLPYSEIPTQYVYKKLPGASIHTWEPRKSHFYTLGRMYSVSPSQTELFHLRILLTCVTGATSYEHLRTVNGITYDNFMSTCLALGLIEDDNEWKNAMHEAEVWMMPQQLRHSFVRILIHCHPIHPEELMKSRDLQIFPSMPHITEVEENDSEISPEQHRVIGSRQYELLNGEQREIVDIILERAENRNSSASKCFFINGPGGSGKTFIYTTLYHLLQSQKKNVTTMAFTGIAATLLPRCKTVHKTFKLPIALYSDSSLTIKTQSKEADYCRNMNVIMWDEGPMSPKHALSFVNRSLRDVTNSQEPFGGKISILGGDFRQLLPVKKNATRGELVDLSIKFRHLWPHFTQFTLTKNMRTRAEEVEIAKYLLTVGDGTANSNDSDLNLPEHCLAARDADIAQDVYGEIMNNKQFDKLAKCTILSARNVDVDDINIRVVELLDKTTERIYTSINSIKNCENGGIRDALLPEYLETLNPPNLPPHELRLRQYTVVMLIRNLSVNEGLCNGTRLQILDFSNHLLKCKVLTGDKMGDIVFINRIVLHSDNTYPFEFGRRQFPIKLAFAMTINKSQGKEEHDKEYDDVVKKEEKQQPKMELKDDNDDDDDDADTVILDPEELYGRDIPNYNKSCARLSGPHKKCTQATVEILTGYLLRLQSLQVRSAGASLTVDISNDTTENYIEWQDLEIVLQTE
ncbi:uncharacterized protein LOC122854854 [Aphidius gifuensis]|uniref:uncharacterized protein LOC122854854 n=1 Tax=Aphidius gifuensis TaxID=684658 RepID=UPI001CDD679E|nr:uncharacterized protein LOC122854854 [Aphidius gifuensis]